MKNAIIGIDPDYDYLFDPQQANPVCYCPVCGREIYAEGREVCEFCEEDV